MSEELKPCPYCGDAMPVVSEAGKCYTVECGCGMNGPYGCEPEDAIASWNSLPRRSNIERVERERDWLALNLSRNSYVIHPPQKDHAPACAYEVELDVCFQCWLEAAHNAVVEEANRIAGILEEK